MSRRWFKCFLTHFVRYVVLLFGGAIFGAFIGYSIVNAVNDYGIAALFVVVIAVVMLGVGGWIASMAATEDEMAEAAKQEKITHMRKKDNYSA